MAVNQDPGLAPDRYPLLNCALLLVILVGVMLSTINLQCSRSAGSARASIMR